MNILVSAVIRCESTATEYTNGGQQMAAASTGIEYGCRLFSPAGSERYFTVDYNEEDHEAVESSSNAKRGIEGDEGELSSLLSEFTTYPI